MIAALEYPTLSTAEVDTMTNSGAPYKKLLSSTLKELEDYEFLTRKQFNEIPSHVEYSLTEKGKMLYPIFAAMEQWIQKYSNS